jgi:hypothetical protein
VKTLAKGSGFLTKTFSRAIRLLLKGSRRPIRIEARENAIAGSTIVGKRLDKTGFVTQQVVRVPRRFVILRRSRSQQRVRMDFGKSKNEVAGIGTATRRAINLFKSPHRVHSCNPLGLIISRMSDSRMDCRPALRIRFRLAQNFPGHGGNVWHINTRFMCHTARGRWFCRTDYFGN